MPKRFKLKIFSADGVTHLADINPQTMETFPRFLSTIQSGAGQMEISYLAGFDNFGEGVTIKNGNIGKLYLIDQNNPLGLLIYTGVLVTYTPYIETNKSGVRLTFLGIHTLLQNSFYKSGANYTFSQTKDPSQMAVDVINHFSTIYTGLISSSGVVNTGGSESFTFQRKKHLEALNSIFGIIPDGWFWRITPDGILTIDQLPAVAMHTFTFGKDLVSASVEKSMQTTYNAQLLVYGATPTELYTSNPTSISTYGLRENLAIDAGITIAGTATAANNKFISFNKDQKIKAKMRINALYNIESIKVGDTCRVENMKVGSTLFSQNMLIARVDYNGGNFVDLSLGEVNDFRNSLIKIR